VDRYLAVIYVEVTVFLLLIYIKVVSLTSRIEIRYTEADGQEPRGGMYLFWHKDAYSIVLLRELLDANPRVIVADSDNTLYWTRLLHRLGADCIVSTKPFWLKGILIDQRIAFLALDGPEGPQMIANACVVKALKRFNIRSYFVACHLERRVVFGNGWALVNLPVPFSKIGFTVSCGSV
jgi:lysophospholipid acyltransferase (LPLAT)-like uncharacterized protein